MTAISVACPQTLHDWVRKHEIDTGTRDGVPSEERERVKALGREVKSAKAPRSRWTAERLTRCLGLCGPCGRVVRIAVSNTHNHQ